MAIYAERSFFLSLETCENCKVNIESNFTNISTYGSDKYSLPEGHYIFEVSKKYYESERLEASFIGGEHYTLNVHPQPISKTLSINTKEKTRIYIEGKKDFFLIDGHSQITNIRLHDINLLAISEDGTYDTFYIGKKDTDIHWRIKFYSLNQRYLYSQFIGLFGGISYLYETPDRAHGLLASTLVIRYLFFALRYIPQLNGDNNNASLSKSGFISAWLVFSLMHTWLYSSTYLEKEMTKIAETAPTVRFDKAKVPAGWEVSSKP